MEYKVKNVLETGKIAQNLAKQITQNQPVGRAAVIALEGELGAGKTTFIKAFAKTLGVKDKLTSPTFVILRKFTIHGSEFDNLIHVDAYRLNSGKELEHLGIREIFTNPKNIVLIEWAERVADILPKEYIRVHMDHISEDERKISISN